MLHKSKVLMASMEVTKGSISDIEKSLKGTAGEDSRDGNEDNLDAEEEEQNRMMVVRCQEVS